MELLGPGSNPGPPVDASVASKSYSEALRRLGMRAAGSNHRTLRKYAERIWRIPTDHFDPHANQREQLANRVP